MDFYNFQNINSNDVPVPTNYYTSDPRLYYNSIQLNTELVNNYQLYDVNLPPANIIDTKSDDELWIETWLSTIGKIHINLNSTVELKQVEIAPVKKNNNIQIHEVKNILKNSIQLLNKLQTLRTFLKDNVATMSSTNWKKNASEIGIIKEQFSKNMHVFEDADSRAKICKIIEQRRKKRKCQKNRRKQRVEQKAKMREDKLKAHKEIDQWLESQKDEVERTKQEENMKRDADCVLAEVTKKKSDARKSIALISSLIKLRQVREHAAVQRGEKTSLEDRNAFNKVTEHLAKIWNDALRVYTKEEQGLRVMLEQNAAEDTIFARAAKEKKIIEQWEMTLFGSKCIPNHIYWNLTAAEKDMDTFIAIRKSWDTFLTSKSEASRIPIGWVVPNSNPNQSWSQYLSV